MEASMQRLAVRHDGGIGSVAPTKVSSSWVHSHWKLRQEIALIDLRGEGRHAEGHPLFATCIPYVQIELRIRDAVPRLSTPIVFLHDDDAVAGRTCHVVEAMGYSQVALLDGGISGWTAAGLELFADVNSPSKAFGELVAERKHTPLLPALALRDRIDRGDDIVIWDARTPEEYRTMSIPGGVSVPGADLVATASQLPLDPQTGIVVNCAGRTRSIIGAQSLINAGVRNPVHALRNGTIGWTLDGLRLEKGQDRTIDAPTGIDGGQSRDVAYRAGVRWIGIDDLKAIERDHRRTFYGFDLRPAAAFVAGHIPGFVHVAGGQLVQETDMNAAVRGARIIVYDDIGTRANMTASWLAQMGWDCCILERSQTDETERGSSVRRPPLPEVDWIEADELTATSNMTVIDLGSSAKMAQGHIGGSIFVPRERLGPFVQSNRPEHLVIISDDGAAAAFAACDLDEDVKVSVLRGGRAGWAGAGHPLATGSFDHFGPVDDVYRRPYVGTNNPVEAMQAYLDWEYGLVAQLERDGSHGFHVI